MKKYKKFKTRRMFNPYIIFIIAIVGIMAMSVGYAMSTDTLYISGRANAKYFVYTITYELNGGTNPENPVTEYTLADVDLLPVPTKEGYRFVGWYEDENFEGERVFETCDLQPGNAILYAKWKSGNAYFEEYRHDEPFTFTGSNYLDSGIALYSEENWQKDFEIGFTIDAYTPSQNVGQATFVNAKYENESLKYPGLVVRRTESTNNIEVTQTINHGQKVAKNIPSYSIPCTIKIYRISGVVYYNVNNGALIQLQDMSNFNQQFNTTTWFGGSQDINGNLMRGLKGTLSNMYVKIEEYETRKYTVTFNANGGSVSTTRRRVKEYDEVGELPIPTRERYNFLGWYSDPSLTTPVNEHTAISADVTFYAKWSNQLNVEVNGNYYLSLAEAINAVENSNEYTTITIHDDITSKVTIPSGKKIILDIQNNIISNDGVAPLFENYGDLKIINGTLTSDTTQGLINNDAGGTLTITGGELIATGTKQVVYNNGGTVVISGDAYLSSNSSIRATVQNLANGSLTITGGTIISYNFSAIVKENGTMTIGVKDGTIDTQSPVIQGKSYGINASNAYNFYDGTIIGRNNAVNNEKQIADIETNSELKHHSETIDGVTYKSIYLDSTP